MSQQLKACTALAEDTGSFLVYRWWLKLSVTPVLGNPVPLLVAVGTSSKYMASNTCR